MVPIPQGMACDPRPQNNLLADGEVLVDGAHHYVVIALGNGDLVKVDDQKKG